MPTRFSHLQGHHLLSMTSLAWVGILLTTDLHSPRAIWVTVALLVVNAFVCVVTLVRHKRILVLLNLVQIVLFAVLHYQVFRVWGKHHYAYDSEPDCLDWLQFTAAHVLRAVDLLDVLEAYGISLQNVRHHSTLSGLLLLAMHLTVDIFLLALAIRWGLRLWHMRAERASEPLRSRSYLAQFIGSRRQAPALRRRPGKGLLVCLLLVLFCAASQRWRDPDWLLWPLDNVVRTADIGDAMQLFTGGCTGSRWGSGRPAWPCCCAFWPGCTWRDG